VAGDELWVAQGAYQPTLTPTRTISFNLKSGVAIYGGFLGGETLLSQRNFTANITTLTGDLNSDDITVGVNENSHHVINGASANATAILDGFTVAAGNASAANPNDRGGAMLMLSGSNATFRNCNFINNRCTFGGGAGYVNASSPTYFNCIFQNNQGGSFGGAFDTATNCATVFDRCSFIGNTAGRAGALEAFSGCTPTLTNCVFRGNTATGAGGAAMFVSTSTATLRNCTIAGNSATSSGPGILSTGSTVTVHNSVVWGNTGPGSQLSGTTFSVSYSCVQGGFTGAGNVSTDPVFASLAGGDVHLAPGSSAIDAGNNSLLPAGVTVDRDGLPRFIEDPFTPNTCVGTPPLVDMGAFEVQQGAPPPPANNNCASATIITAGSFNFTTLGATTDGPDEPAGCNFNGFSQVSNDIWYRYVAQCNGVATVSLCGASFDAKVAIYGSVCPAGSGLTIACNDDFCGTSPQVSFPVVSGTIYRLRVGGANGAAGTGTMVVSCAIPPACPADIAPAGGNGSVNVDDLLAVINAWGACGDPNNCPADIAPIGPPQGNDVVNVDDLLAVINGWGFCP